MLYTWEQTSIQHDIPVDMHAEHHVWLGPVNRLGHGDQGKVGLKHVTKHVTLSYNVVLRIFCLPVHPITYINLEAQYVYLKKKTIFYQMPQGLIKQNKIIKLKLKYN